MRGALLAAVWYACGAASMCSQAQEPAWYLKVESSSGTVLVREDGTDRRLVADAARRAVREEVSPDGRFALYVDASEGDAEVFRRDLTTQAIVKLTDNTAADNDPAWSPDGRQVAFSSNRGGRWQVYVMDGDGGRVTPITEAETGAWKPQFSATGQLAYLRLGPGTGRDQLVDLVTLVAGEARTLLAQRRVTDFAWSPDGTLLAVGVLADEGGRLTFVDGTAGTVNEIDLKAEVDERLSWHGAFQIHWRPDGGAVACQLSFAGGRLAGATKSFGDDEIFVITLDGRATWFEVEDGEPRIIGWERVAR